MSATPEPAPSSSPAAPSPSTTRDPLAPNVEDLYLESYAFTTAAALVGSVDRKIFVLLRDGRNLFGILRTFDQFANLVVQDTYERIYLEDQKKFAEVYRGVFMVRGENVVMMGELDIDREDDHLELMEQIDYKEAELELEAKHKRIISEQKVRSRKLLEKGLINDFVKGDMY
ncbi:Sm-like protein LSm1 [Spathaspora sp. JA1]|nr:Sm-like protein LSm1 [Spathaspora sp. JA1]